MDMSICPFVYNNLVPPLWGQGFGCHVISNYNHHSTAPAPALAPEAPAEIVRSNTKRPRLPPANNN